jgi:hypothetical protein
MRTGKILVMVLVLVWGMAATAPAVTINTSWLAEWQGANLYQIITAWGFPVDNDALEQATPLEVLPPGQYQILHYASYTIRSQLLGIYPAAAEAPGHFQDPGAGALTLLQPKRYGQWACDLSFRASWDFALFDDTAWKFILLTTQNQNQTDGRTGQSSGLIFDLGEFNPQYAGQYIIAFDDWRWLTRWTNLDYNDLVVHLAELPLPGTLPLLGGGLLGLGLLGCYRRRSPPPG